ncbi:MAG: hypothetical protein JNJ88_04305 [Planctomycetes bacterium]|nr:hypothetical protein [Planctomycetota bacterium]
MNASIWISLATLLPLVLAAPNPQQGPPPHGGSWQGPQGGPGRDPGMGPGPFGPQGPRPMGPMGPGRGGRMGRPGGPMGPDGGPREMDRWQGPDRPKSGQGFVPPHFQRVFERMKGRGPQGEAALAALRDALREEAQELWVAAEEIDRHLKGPGSDPSSSRPADGPDSGRPR